MISKVTKLSGIGTLHAPLQNGVLALRKKTIIYGENGRGKTTFVAVLRSLACGSTFDLQKRVTIRGTEPQAAQFLIGTQPYDLSNGTWSKTYPGICVFDSAFISENVYSGNNVDAEHRKNLLSFAIGNQGVSLAERVDELATQISAKRGEETAAKAEVRKFVKGPLEPEAFAKSSPAGAGAETQLEEAKKRRDAIGRASTILKLEPISPLQIEPIDRQGFAEVLAETMEALSSDAAQMVREHVESRHVSEKWLEEGSRFETGDICPYCAQDTRGVRLVEAFRISFSEAYRSFKAGLAQRLGALMEPISERKQTLVGPTVDGNRAKLVAWKEFLPDVDLSFDTGAHAGNLRAALDTMQSAKGRKLASPLESVSLTSDESAALDRLGVTIAAVGEYNAARESINRRVCDLRESVSAGDLSAANAVVDEIENRISRGTVAADAASRALLDAIAAREELERQKEAARSALDKHMGAIVGEYQDAINKHLKGCGAAFEIKKLKTVYTGAKPRFEYVIELFGAPVDLANRPAAPLVFDSALSQGDRGALAFAFFLAKLEGGPARSQQIVVFDDPLSSLDSCRRRYTRQQIARLAREVAQVIVLTHEEATVADIAARLTESECAIFALKAHRDFSVFTAASVKEITASDYARYFDVLNHYLHGSGKAEDAVGKVRPFVEINLRYRFPEEFAPDDSLGKMIGHIRKCDGAKPLAKMRPLLATLGEINDYATAHSHGDTALVRAEKMLDSDLRAVVIKTLDFARGLPN